MEAIRIALARAARKGGVMAVSGVARTFSQTSEGVVLPLEANSPKIGDYVNTPSSPEEEMAIGRTMLVCSIGSPPLTQIQRGRDAPSDSLARRQLVRRWDRLLPVVWRVLPRRFGVEQGVRSTRSLSGAKWATRVDRSGVRVSLVAMCRKFGLRSIRRWRRWR